MSAIGSEIKSRYKKMEPSEALLSRTEQMMNDVADKREFSGHARRIAAVAIAMAVLCVLICMIALPHGHMPDSVQPLSADPNATHSPDGEITALYSMPTYSPGGREFALQESSVLSPADEDSIALAEGVTFTVRSIGTTDNGIFAEWTVSSTLSETVYYSLEYDLSISGDIPTNYLFSGSRNRSIDCFRYSKEELLPDVPSLNALTPDSPEYSGNFLHSFASALPEGEITVCFTLHAYIAADGEITDWGDQNAPTAHAEKIEPLTQHLGDMRVYGLQESAFIINIPAYQEALIALQDEKGVGSDIYLEALTQSGVFEKITEVKQEYETGELQIKNKTELTGLEVSLPGRTVHVNSLALTPNMLEMSYTVVMDDMEYSEENAGLIENVLFYIMDDEGRFVASGADGSTILSGFSSVTPYAASDGSQAYDCRLRLPISFDSMPEYFVFAPHRKEVAQYAGTNAERFEHLYSVTAPEECFAVSPGGEVIALEGRVQENDGIRFTLDKTYCKSGKIEMEWTVESELDHDIIYFIQSDFIPANSVWELNRSGGYSVDCYGEFALFDSPAKLLTQEYPSFSGHRSYTISSTEPCPGGEIILTLRAFRAPDRSSLSGRLYSEALMDLYDQSMDDPERYASLITDSSLFEEETMIVQRFSVPPFENATMALIENTQFDFGGRMITIRDLRVTPTGMNMRYEISGADFSAYTGEREYEDMYFVVTSYGSAVGLGHLDKSASTESVHGGTILEDDWDLEQIPEYIVLVPYGEMSEEEYWELRTSRADGVMFERLREIYYTETDQNECIRIYMDGRITTNTLENRSEIQTRTVDAMFPISTTSEPEDSDSFSFAFPEQQNTITNGDLTLGERGIRLYHAGIDDGYSIISSTTEDDSTLNISYHVSAPSDGTYGYDDGWKFAYFPVMPGGTLPPDSMTGFGMLLDENKIASVSQCNTVVFPKGNVPEYIVYMPFQRNYLDLPLDEQDAAMLEDAAAIDPALCFRLVINEEESDYTFAIEEIPAE